MSPRRRSSKEKDFWVEEAGIANLRVKADSSIKIAIASLANKIEMSTTGLGCHTIWYLDTTIQVMKRRRCLTFVNPTSFDDAHTETKTHTYSLCIPH